MKAFLLAGGAGERLRPLTDRLPKCLVPINGTPLLAIWLESCLNQGIEEVLINVSQHADLVEDFLRQSHWHLKIHLVRESRSMGNAGTVLARRAFVEGEESFYIVYTDNLTDASLDRLMARHRAHDGVLTMGLFRTPTPTAAGIVEADLTGRIHSFVEKPSSPRSDLANAGLYVARQTIFDAIPADKPVVDFGQDVFPRLLGRMFGQMLDGVLIDVGTPAGLDRACRERAAWERRTQVSPATRGAL